MDLRPGRRDRAVISVPRTAKVAPPLVGDDGGQREPLQLVPALILAVPMIIAFGFWGLDRGGMADWAVSRAGLAAGDYQLVALHMFAHGGLVHLAFNVVALFALGPAVMQRLGRLSLRSFAAFLVLFLLSGVAGLGAWLAFPHDVPMLGASGAIFGFLGFILRQPDPDKAPIALFSREMTQAFVVLLKLHLPLLAIFAIPLLLGAGYFGLAWEAHLGGFVAGLLTHGVVMRLAGCDVTRGEA